MLYALIRNELSALEVEESVSLKGMQLLADDPLTHISQKWMSLDPPANDTITAIIVVLYIMLALLPGILAVDYAGINDWLQQHSIL